MRPTHLHEAHIALGARMVEFAGYAMPVQYRGVLAESRAVREGVGMFDVSHMGRLGFTGPGTREYFLKVTTNDIDSLTDGTGHYSLLPNADGGVVDDVIVYRVGAEDFRMVVNAANHAKDVAWLQSHLPSSVEMNDTTEATAMIAVQGPNAAATMMSLGAEVADLPMFGVRQVDIAGINCFAARSGYTGEDGFELICGATDAGVLWRALLDANVVPCGLGARDVLRVEAGLPLYGHELTDDRSPISAGLGWVIRKQGGFIGSDAVLAARDTGTPDRVVGVKLEGKRLPMADQEVLVGGEVVGRVSSGVFSSTFDCGLAFAFVRSEFKFGTPCCILMRGKEEPGTLVNKRFFKRGTA